MSNLSQGEIRKLDYLDKKDQQKAQTSPNVVPPSEGLTSQKTTDLSKVYDVPVPSQMIDTSDENFTKHYPPEDGGVGWILLTRNYDEPDGKSWIMLNQRLNNFGLGAATPEQKAMRMANFLDGGDGAHFTPEFFDGNDDWIPPFSDALPKLDKDAGTLTFALPRPESGNTDQDTIKCKIVQRTGKSLGQKFAEADFVSVYKAARDA